MLRRRAQQSVHKFELLPMEHICLKCIGTVHFQRYARGAHQGSGILPLRRRGHGNVERRQRKAIDGPPLELFPLIITKNRPN